jgi:hypothetical protein
MLESKIPLSKYKYIVQNPFKLCQNLPQIRGAKALDDENAKPEKEEEHEG